ncbi:mechanosensitive ion channel family protein [Terribacillus sp. 7520-G]|uniref:mechanosensitive ion channel family protein n=1 Tax=Terribacillus TaxID=459532 RepID=UPI000BA4F843|nr:mechanosensitive ion channel family protein [Terribacillus sp. 7520-G]PAD38829.1 mechanosensitive ion channel protein MscS [Terribacillus sp. 7520-G]
MNVEEQWTSIFDYLTSAELWTSIGFVVLKIVMIIILSMVVVRVANNIVERTFNNSLREKANLKSPIVSERREKTLKKLIQNVITYVVYFTAVVMVLSQLGLNIGALIASAGVAGLAIGFGAQSLVKDVISGFFIIFENQFSVGDNIQTAGIRGDVEEIGLRTCKIRNWTGELHIIPNGNITQVTNFSVHNSLGVLDINVPYEADLQLAEEVIMQVLLELPAEYPEIQSTPQLLGVETLSTSHIVLRAIIETLPMEHFGVAREARNRIKTKLLERNISIPAPRLVMYNKQEAEELMKENAIRGSARE